MAFRRNTQAPQPEPAPAEVAVRGQAAAAVQAAAAAPLEIPDHLLEQIVAMVMEIPADDDSGSWGIIEKLLAAGSWQDLNKPWDGTSGKQLAGRRLVIRDVHRRPSAYDTGPEIFLVASGEDAATGEKITFTTSALAVIIQLATAWTRGYLPILAEITAASKPTERGHVPYHLTIQQIQVGE